MDLSQNNDEIIHKLGWKGILFQFDPLLYADPDTPGWVLFPIMVGLFIPRLFLSYLKVSADGLILHYWPKHTTQVKWEQIARLGRCRFLGFIPCDALYLKMPEAQTKNAALREWGLAKKCIIPLSDFRGWPNGKLAENLKNRIPSIMSEHNN